MFTGGKQSVEDPPGGPGNTYKGGWVPRLHGKDVFRIHDPHPTTSPSSCVSPQPFPSPSSFFPFLRNPDLPASSLSSWPTQSSCTVEKILNVCLRWATVSGGVRRCDEWWHCMEEGRVSIRKGGILSSFFFLFPYTVLSVHLLHRFTWCDLYEIFLFMYVYVFSS